MFTKSAWFLSVKLPVVLKYNNVSFTENRASTCQAQPSLALLPWVICFHGLFAARKQNNIAEKNQAHAGSISQQCIPSDGHDNFIIE